MDSMRQRNEGSKQVGVKKYLMEGLGCPDSRFLENSLCLELRALTRTENVLTFPEGSQAQGRFLH